MTRLEELELELRAGMKKSGQSSYARRAPNASSLPELNRALAGLRELTETDSSNPHVWELLSRAEECLMNFEGAIKSCEKVIELSSRPTKDQRKRLALLRQAFAEWNQLPLQPNELRKLGEYLKSVGADQSAERRSFEQTEYWLENEGIPNPEAIIREFERRGAFSDFQVYRNIILG